MVADKNTYPDPKDQCDICRWLNQCDARRRADDHLCLVAGISKTQNNERQSNGINTAKALAEMPTPMPWKPKRGSPHGFEKVSQQARIQVTVRETGKKQLETSGFDIQDFLEELGTPPSEKDLKSEKNDTDLRSS